MMTAKIPGVTYEQRCHGAADILRLARESVNKLMEAEIRSLQEMHILNEERKRKLNPEVRACLEEFPEKGEYAFSNSSQKAAESVYGLAVAMCNSWFGADATAAALEMIKRETPGN